MDLGDLLFDVTDGIARITLNRPEAANAITATQRNRAIDWLEAASGDPFVRAWC